MSLRKTLALKLVGLSLPLLVVVAFLRADFVWRTEVRSMAEFAMQRMESIDLDGLGFDEPRERPGPSWRPPGSPEGRPGRGPWGPGPGGGRPDQGRPDPDRGPGSRPRPRERGLVRVFAYDDGFLPSMRDAPPFPSVLRERLESGAERAAAELRLGPSWHMLVALRSPWPDSPAAHVLALRPNPERIGSFGSYLLSSLPIALVVLLVALFASAPLVTRVRRLTTRIQAAAKDHYRNEIEVTGDDELSELAGAFRDAGLEIRSHIGDLEEREATLRRFLENTSHDVALPLTVLQGHLAAMDRSLVRGEAVQESALHSALQETHYLASLLSNLSVIARVEGHSAPLEEYPVRLGNLVERVISRERMVARSRGIAVEEALPEGEVQTLGDETLIEQALSNLVHNAVAHGHEEGHVTVILESRSGSFLLRVLDDGPGVPRAELDRIVERGWRGEEARDRKTHGRGLGLAIALDVARRHGFELRFESVSGGGFEARLSGPSLTL